MKNLFLLLTLGVLFTAQMTVRTFADDEGDCAGQQDSATEVVPSNIAPMEETTDHINAIMADGEGPAETPREEVKRFELFRFEKDYNEENVLHYGINVNIPSCTIAKKENGAPQFNSYWIMGEERGQKKNMTRDDLKKLGPVVLSQDDHNVTFKMKAFKDVPIRKKEITIEAKIVDGICKVTGNIELDDGHKIDLSKIFAKISTFAGIPTGVDYLDVHGLDRTTGATTQVRFDQ